MVREFEITLQKRSAKESGWLLLKNGANAIETNYTNSFVRQPSPQKMKVITQELEVQKQVVQKAGWQLVQQQNYNSANRKPEQTEQSKIILEAYSRALLKELQERKKNTPNSPGLNEDVKAFNNGLHNSLIPPDANDWLAYLKIYNEENKLVNRLVVVLILSNNEHTEKFWNQRVKKYQRAAEKVFVFGVFSDSDEANTHKELLKESGLRITSLEKISTLLNSIKERSLQNERIVK